MIRCSIKIYQVARNHCSHQFLTVYKGTFNLWMHANSMRDVAFLFQCPFDEFAFLWPSNKYFELHLQENRGLGALIQVSVSDSQAHFPFNLFVNVMYSLKNCEVSLNQSFVKLYNLFPHYHTFNVLASCIRVMYTGPILICE